MKNETTFPSTEKKKIIIYIKNVESKSNKECTVLRDMNQCTFCKKCLDNRRHPWIPTIEPLFPKQEESTWIYIFEWVCLI